MINLGRYGIVHEKIHTILLSGSLAIFLIILASFYMPGNAQQATAVNVLSCGAKGDGKTDDTAAFIAALKKAGNSGSVYAPGGHKYALFVPSKAGAIRLTGSQSLHGDGASSIIEGVISGTVVADKTGILYLDSSNKVSNVTITSSATAINYLSGLIIDNGSKSSSSVSSVTFNGILGYDALLLSAHNCVMANNSFTYMMGSGACVGLFNSSSNISVKNNQFSGSPASYTLGLSSLAISAKTIPSNLTVTNNTFLNSALTLAGVNGATISQNVFNNNGVVASTIFFIGSASRGLVSNLVFDHNTYTGIGQGDQQGTIRVTGYSSNYPKAGGTAGVQNISFTNNTVNLLDLKAFYQSSLGKCLQSTGSLGGIQNMTVSGNTFTNTGCYAMNLDAVQNASILNNDIVNAPNKGTGEGIATLANMSGTLLIQGNKFTNLGNDLTVSIGTFKYLLPLPHKAVVDIALAKAVTSAKIINNVYTGAANNLSYFIDSAIAKTSHSGNTTVGNSLPSYP